MTGVFAESIEDGADDGLALGISSDPFHKLWIRRVATRSTTFFGVEVWSA